MKLIHVVPAITEESSGPTYSVTRLCESLVQKGASVTLAALDWAPIHCAYPYLMTFRLGFGPRALGRSPDMKRWLYDQVSKNSVDIIHNHGMWQMNSLYPAWAASRGTMKLVSSPRGALSSWAMRYGSRAKLIFWPLLQRPAMKRVDCFHATAEAEYRDIRARGFKQPVAIIPNGIDIPELAVYRQGKTPERTLLFLGRIHKTKGLELLLQAWARIQADFPSWNLTIAGSDGGFHGSSGYLRELKELAAELALTRVLFAGELRGADKWAAYQGANLFVLPSYSENFAMTVAESLAAGTPVVTTHGAPWSGLVEHNAGWWVDASVGALTTALRDALTRPASELASMGERGRNWMREDFSWEGVGTKMSEVYRWLCDKSLAKPAWVRLD